MCVTLALSLSLSLTRSLLSQHHLRAAALFSVSVLDRAPTLSRALSLANFISPSRIRRPLPLSIAATRLESMGKIDSIWSRIRRGKRKADAAIDDSEADEVDLSSEERFSVATDEPPARASTTTTTSAAATSTTAATPSRALASSSSSNVPALVVSSPQDHDDHDDDDDDDEHYRRLSVSDGVPRQAHASSSNLDAELEVELDGSPSEPSMLADMARELLATTSSSSSSAAGTAAAMPSHTRSSPTLSPQHTRTINWRKGGIIGSGSYGSVYLGLNTDTGTLIAVKQVFVGDDTDGIDELVREVEILRTLSHSSIVQYLGASREASVRVLTYTCPLARSHSLTRAHLAARCRC